MSKNYKVTKEVTIDGKNHKVGEVITLEEAKAAHFVEDKKLEETA